MRTMTYCASWRRRNRRRRWSSTASPATWPWPPTRCAASPRSSRSIPRCFANSSPLPVNVSSAPGSQPAAMDSALLGPAEIREIAGRLGIWPSKRLGQNFVTDAGTVRRIVALAGLSPSDAVLEVGPGFGSLTLGLLGAARRVVAVELDPVLAAELPCTVASRAPALVARLELVTADAARVGDLPGEPLTALVANLPYNAAVPVVLHLLATVPSLRHGLVMVQAEVADRMTGPPGRAGAADGVLAGAQRGLRAGRLYQARPARRRRDSRRGVRGGGRRLLATAQDAPRRTGLLGGITSGGGADPAGSRRGSTGAR